MIKPVGFVRPLNFILVPKQTYHGMSGRALWTLPGPWFPYSLWNKLRSNAWSRYKVKQKPHTRTSSTVQAKMDAFVCPLQFPLHCELVSLKANPFQWEPGSTIGAWSGRFHPMGQCPWKVPVDKLITSLIRGYSEMELVREMWVMGNTGEWEVWGYKP